MIVKVAASQLRLNFCKDKDEFFKKIEVFVKEAKEKNVELIAFPEDCGTILLGLLWRKPISVIKEHFKPEEGILKLFKKIIKIPSIAKIFSILSPLSKKIFEETFSQLSAKYKIYIMAGTIMLEENYKVYNVAYLFDKDGNIIGTQKKTHLYLTEIGWGFTPSDELEVFETEIGNIGIAICMDNGYPEVGRILRLKGADIIIDPSFNPDYYYHIASLNGLWARCQENYTFGIHSCMVGDLFGKLVFRGKSKILAPCYLTEDKTGIISIAKDDNSEELVVGELNFEKLYKLRKEFDIIEIINTNLLNKYSHLYDEKIRRRKINPNIFRLFWGLTKK
jgi:predicted amidohydrolase